MSSGRLLDSDSAHSRERAPLLRTGESHRRDDHADSGYDAIAHAERIIPEDGALADTDPRGLDSDEVHSARRQLGLASTVSLIFNRVIGTGIFATPSVILHASGSVGLSLVVWLLGATVALCGTAVYTELGTGLPRNGGEKNYLEFIYRRPKLLATCIYAMYAVFTGWEAAQCFVFGEYTLHAIDPTHPPSPFAARVTGVVGITFALILHGTHLKAGVKLQDALSGIKVLILIAIALSGLGALAGLPGFRLENPPDNFDPATFWKGSASGGANAFITGLSTVIWCFTGYSNANYALAEVRDPVRTIRRAAPLAMVSITVVYMFVNIAYLAVVDKDAILGSGRIVAALYFGRLWGVGAERIVSVIVALSTMGNILAVMFTHSRVVQELGREGVLPWSSFFASNKPYNSPFAGLFQQWIVSGSMVLLVPPGDAYLFMLSVSVYPLAIINLFVSGGLLLIHLPAWTRSKTLRALSASYEWAPPVRAPTTVVLVFFLSNVFVVLVPLLPPANGFKAYEHLPYWSHVLVSWLIALVGVTYWYAWTVWAPKRGGYRIVREWIREDDGLTRGVIRKVKTESLPDDIDGP